jgi:hypothetical protein
MGENISVYKVFVGKVEQRDYLEDIDMDGNILLEWILKEQDCRAWIGLIWLRIGTFSGLSRMR